MSLWLVAAGCAVPFRTSAQQEGDDNASPPAPVVIPDLDPNTFDLADVDRFALVIAGQEAISGPALTTTTTVPATSVIRLRGHAWVYTPAGNGRFTRVEVVPGRMLPGNRLEIAHGLDPGTEVVANAFAFQRIIQQ